MPDQDFLDLFKEDTRTAVGIKKGNADALKATKLALEHALVRYQDGELQTNAEDKTPYWDFLRRHLSQEQDFAIILALASRHSLAWTNKFIESLVQYNADTQMFTVNTNRLKTLIFLQKHCGLQSRDLSVTTSPYTLPEDVRLFERPIEGETFNQNLLDKVYDFLKKLKDSEAMNLAMSLVKQGFLNFSMLHKKITLEEGAFLTWLTQWAKKCHVDSDMIAQNSLDILYKSDDSLEAHQPTIRHMVRYGLSPKWLKDNALSANGATHTTLNATVASDVTFDSALAYHQSQEVNIHQNAGNARLEQPIVDAITSNINDTTPEWLKKYADPEDQYILHRLKEALSLNAEPALERLKFYHDSGRLETLIKQVRNEKLSLTEVQEYDTLRPCKSVEKFKDYSYTPRVLPRLLVGVPTHEHAVPLQGKIKQMALYDMEDYRPMPNSTPDDGKNSSVIEFFKLYDIYLKNYFEQVILPIAEERARLYEKLCLLRSKNKAQSQFEKSCLGSFDKNIRLVEQKIDIFSGFLEEACFELKRAELAGGQAKENNDYYRCGMNLYYHFKRYCEDQVTFDDYWKWAELSVMPSKPALQQLNTNQVGIYLDSNDQRLKLCFLYQPDDPRDKSQELFVCDLENQLNFNLVQKIKNELTNSNVQDNITKKITSKPQIHAILKIADEQGFSLNGLKPMKQNSLYRLERDGVVPPSNIKSSCITRTDCEKSVMNNPDHPVTSCLAYIVGKLLSCTKWLIQIPAVCNDMFGWKKIDIAYAGVFYNTRSQQTFFNALEKNWYMDEKLRQDQRSYQSS